MDKSTIDTFWKKRAAEGKGRWTDNALLQYEYGWLSQYAPPGARILDLGSGPAELSTRLLTEEGSLTLVDKYEDFLKHAPVGHNIRHVCANVLDFADTESYDLTLLFGVVTHLEENEETQIYQNAAKLMQPGGALVVKNQVSPTTEKLVEGYSSNLKHDYCGRYPGLFEQHERIGHYFKQVDIVRYPKHFNPWPDTLHVAFIGTHPIGC